MKNKLSILLILVSLISYSQCYDVNLELSDPFSLVLNSDIYNESLSANGLPFERVKVIKKDGLVYSIYENQTDEPLDMSNFKLGDSCMYPNDEAMFTYNINEMPEGEKYMVFNETGSLISEGMTDSDTIGTLPRDRVFYLSIGDFDIKKMTLSFKPKKSKDYDNIYVPHPRLP